MKRISLFDTSHVVIKGLPFLTENHLNRFPKEDMIDIFQENKALEFLSYHLSGGVLCFETTAEKLNFQIAYANEPLMNHMSPLGESGFDLYVIDQHEFIFYDSIRPFPRQKEINITVNLPQSKPVKLMMYTPLYARVLSAEVLLEDDELIRPFDPKYKGQMLWYGTSITQGACASRPGMSYTNQLSRFLHMEMINLGFSGNGLGELSVAKVTHKLKDLDAIIIDYEANAGALGKLKDTLIPWILTVREKHQSIPIIIISRIPFVRERWIKDDHEKRMMHHQFQKDIVEQLKDMHPLYFVDGEKLIDIDETDVTVDGIHLNDLGMTLFAKRMKDYFKDLGF